MSTQPEQSPEQIEREIDETRSHLNETIADIQQRLSPNTLMDDAINYVKNNKTLQRQVVSTVRDNPAPLLLIGIGIIWLVATGATGAKQRGRPRTEGPYPGERVDTGLPARAHHPQGPLPADSASKAGAGPDRGPAGRIVNEVPDTGFTAPHKNAP